MLLSMQVEHKINMAHKPCMMSGASIAVDLGIFLATAHLQSTNMVLQLQLLTIQIPFLTTTCHGNLEIQGVRDELLSTQRGVLEFG
jgi:hypothetical protein